MMALQLSLTLPAAALRTPHCTGRTLPASKNCPRQPWLVHTVPGVSESQPYVSCSRHPRAAKLRESSFTVHEGAAAI